MCLSVQLVEGSEKGTHRVCDGVGVGVGDPGHLPLTRAHVGGGDVDAGSWKTHKRSTRLSVDSHFLPVDSSAISSRSCDRKEAI